MKFIAHLSSLVHQNSWLKIIAGGLGFLLLISVCVIFTLSLRRPLVFEHSCSTELAKLSNTNVTETEVKEFIRKVLPERFDSDLVAERSYFEDGEILAKNKEQAMLKDRGIKQKLLITDIEIKNELVFVKADRLISLSDIKSVLALPLKIQLNRQTRSETNSYGLIIVKVESNSENLIDKNQIKKEK